MLKWIKQFLRRWLGRRGLDLTLVVPAKQDPRRAGYPFDFDQDAVDLCQYVKPFTMTSKERVFALRQSVQYVVNHDVPGHVVECGVWKGGSMMAVAKTLIKCDASDRMLYLFDTFEGMPQPTNADRSAKGPAAAELYNQFDQWCYSDLDEVKRNLNDTGYDPQNMVFVPGKVEDTIPQYAPDPIALLRLDTDWYESTYHELVHLYPRLSPGGVLILDDYGHWSGAKKAVDQYFAENNLNLFLNRIDYSGRLCIKPA
jgi:hypothetical protein